MRTTLAQLADISGMKILDHLEREAAVPVADALQAQGDLLVIPLGLVALEVSVPDAPAQWREVPAHGLELLRSAGGGNPHTLVADSGTCHWSPDARDTVGLALGAIRATGPAYLLHPEHGGTGIAPGTYVLRRQREGSGYAGIAARHRTRLAARLVAD